MKINSSPYFDNLKDFEGIKRFITIFCRNVQDVVNSGLSFEDNFNSQTFVDVVFTGTGEVKTLMHSLNRVPVGYLTLRNSSGVVIFDAPGTVFTNKSVNIQATGAGTVTVLVF